MKSKDIEKMIHLYLDAELDAEQRAQVEQMLENDMESRRLYDQLQQAHSVLQKAVDAVGRGSDSSFEMIYAQARDSFADRPAATGRLWYLQFAVGLAAGLLLALGLFGLYKYTASTPDSAGPQLTQSDPRNSIDADDLRRVSRFSDDVKPQIHEVDLYYYVDPDGREWLIEGVRHEVVKQASAGSI